MDSKRITWPKGDEPAPRAFQISVLRSAGQFGAELFGIKGEASPDLNTALTSLTRELFQLRTKMSNMEARFLTDEAREVLQKLNEFLPTPQQQYQAGEMSGRRLA